MFAIDDIRAASALGLCAFRDLLLQIPSRDALLVLLPLLIVLSTFLFLLLLFLLCVVLLRRRRGIALRDHDGPVDMSREDLVQGEGGFDGVESRWLESVPESDRRSYLRAKDFQTQYPPNSQPTDITLSQFLSIQEKGVSAWSFDPDYEMVSSLLVHARTELTFLPDPASASSVQSNLPLPKLNEVYYWEVKMFDLPESTNVAVGLATKPYPSFRLPGHGRYSIAYHSSGDKSHNYPFTATSYGAMLKEGDVLGVGYRPRSGTVFFTRNGRKLEDAFIGLGNWNLFPTIGADGPCSLHVNLGQGGFVFIEANVKKWGLAPSVGTLAPPPAYGSERGSILLESGVSPGSVNSAHSGSRRTRRSRPNQRLQTPSASSPLRPSPITSPPPPPLTPPPPITPINEEPDVLSAESSQERYISPTDMPFHSPHNAHIPASPPPEPTSPTSPAHSPSPSLSRSPAAGANPFIPPRRRPSPPTHPTSGRPDSEMNPVPQVPRLAMPPDSPVTPGNPPTPNPIDIHLQALSGLSAAAAEHPQLDRLPRESSVSRREPPAYSPLDAYAYRDGVRLDLPPEIIEAAFERGTIPGDLIPHQGGDGRRRSRRSQRRRGEGGTGAS
ncbi:concanavalin A-like lectin/glucanase domain-containing protein [Vararia minispora EC-137]|uniref:Concanavalin A-like lectin/glucanase domain-containing protein n=1 Tax=Vararia minispora EC-137 TaxID=1314806 RepID=A0ACB8QGE2_9AGAM|nr:concanavalin A-like lectin/glucanase domain-containing protein [Vararia minispora EC-137]